ncbi:MAG: aminotransferase class V-fold PLP-dependent enzyme [Armatimonadetes bacterium]|nr:aminotransferase class V-fold PLP-dependent enzyme [Armatimonadota bacterium]
MTVSRERSSDLEASALEEAYAGFLAAYPQYEHTWRLDALRTTEYRRLDDLRQTYLDYTGGSLYAESQLEAHLALLRRNVLGNPHSLNPTSEAMTRLVERARRHILEFFDASPDEYVAIVTPNATGALKLVGEAYPFGAGDRFLLTFDNHNSVNGIREFARARGASVTYVPMVLPQMRVDEAVLHDHLDQAGPGGHNLFAYPAQSNFSGVQHPLEWIDVAKARGWDVLLDAAAFVPTNRLDLSRWKPDFASLSFYKMFGYPTGVGALLARRDALARLRRPWFAGGTITVASVQGDRYYLAEGEAAFEDGTVNYLSIPAVEIGLRHLAAIGIETIHERVRCLTGWVIEHLLRLHHTSGTPLVRLYGPSNTGRRGGTVAMNFYDPRGRFIDHRHIEQEASGAGISLRTGCFCNPGGGEVALGLSQTELVACFSQPQERLTMDDVRLCIDGKSSGAVRVSLGLVSNFSDVYRFVEFARGFIDRSL